jgi:hypothetical protein
VREKINPVKLRLNIQKLEQKKTGTVIISLNNKEEKEKLHKEIQDKIPELKTIKPTVRRPKIEFLVYKNKHNLTNDNQQAVEYIREQNRWDVECPEGEATIIRRYEVKNKRAEKFIMEINEDLLDHIKEKQMNKIYVGWVKIAIRRHIQIIKCYRCQGYGHISKECTKKMACSRCSDHHRYDQCTSNVDYCANCYYSNLKYNTQYDPYHQAHDIRKCQIYRDVFRSVQKRMQ